MEKRSKSKKKRIKKETIQVVDFATFFNDKVLNRELAEHDREPVRLFFLEAGLKDLEDLKLYTEIFKKY